MRKALIDTNIYIAFKRNEQRITTAFQNLDYIGLDMTVLAELHAGFKSGSKELKNTRELEEFCNSPRVHLLNHDEQTAHFYAHIFQLLRNKGKPIPTNDLWIAAVTMQHGLALFTRDIHFQYIEGLIMKSDY